MGEVEKKSMHTKIIVGLGAVLFVANLINPAAMLAKKKNEEAQVSASSESTAQMFAAKSSNPHISWFDKLFCRGRSAASFCSEKVRHPKAEEIIEREALAPSPEDERVEAFSFSKKR